MEKQPVKVSFFIHRWEKKSTVIFLDEFVTDVRGPRWKVATLAYRDYLRRQMTKDAEDVKSKMPGIVAAGVCRGGHAASQVRELSQLLMLDFDDVNERLEEVIVQLRELPYVVLQLVSISGRGIKVLIRVEVENERQYATAYAIVAGEVSRLVDFRCDMQCRDLGRICSGVWDENVYYRPDAEPFAWRELVQPKGEERTQPDATTACASAAGGFMSAFLDEFGQRNVFAPGGRHDFVLKLGRVARYKGFSPDEMKLLKELALDRFTESGFEAAEMEKTLFAGYQYANSVGTPPKQAVRVHKVQGSPSVSPEPSTAGEDEDELSAKSEELRQQVSYFPDEIFNRLPQFLSAGVAVARSKRERDMLLMGMLANISGCLPGVQILYDQLYFSPHFYFTTIAQAATGKGVLALAALLPGAINEHYIQLGKQAKRKYDEELLRWEMEQREALKSKHLPNLDLRPEEPVKIAFQVSPNVSKSQLIIFLETNGKLGVVMNAPELDMVSNAMRMDCGKHDDVFRAAFQHEVASSAFKVDGRQIMAHDPHLACCFAGTPAQLIAFIQSLENGLYSRISFYTAQGQLEFRSAAPRKGRRDLRAVFGELSEELLKMHLFLAQSPTEVVFTPEQWARHTVRFSEMLAEVVSEKDDSPAAIVLRHGLIAARIATVLTALRKCECAWSMTEYVCTDDDFDTAMQLTEVLLEHSLLLSTSLPGDRQKPRPLQAFYRIRPVLNELGKYFTYSEFVGKAGRHGVSVSAAKRLLKKLLAIKVLDKEEDKYVKTRGEGSAEARRVNPEPSEP